MNPESVNGFLNGYSGVILLGLGMIFGALWWVKSILKKNPDMTFGDIANRMFMREKLSIFIVTAFVINFSEGLMAASITPIHETAVNPLARILGHMVIAVAGITCGLTLPSQFFKIFEKDTKYRAWIIILFIFALFGTFFLPYVNLSLIANGLKQTQLLKLYIMGMLPWNWGHMEAYYQMLGIKYYKTFSPFDNMQYVMAVSVAMTGVHYFLVIFDGCYIILNAKLDSAAKQAAGTPTSAAAAATSAGAASDPITRLVKYYSNNSLTSNKETEYINKAHSVYDSLDDAGKAKLATLNSDLVTKINNLDKNNNLSAPDKAAAKIELRKEIHTFFAASKQNHKGYSITMSQVNYNPNP